MELARSWYESEAYQAIRSLRMRHTEGDVILVRGGGASRCGSPWMTSQVRSDNPLGPTRIEGRLKRGIGRHESTLRQSSFQDWLLALCPRLWSLARGHPAFGRRLVARPQPEAHRTRPAGHLRLLAVRHLHDHRGYPGGKVFRPSPRLAMQKPMRSAAILDL